nr:PREDICTED: uncharacterized protein LOC105677355 [Linepithema humile]
MHEIPLDVTIDELKTTFSKENLGFQISVVFRLKRKNKITKTWKKCQLICITIKDENLPGKIILWRCVTPVHAYIPNVRICYNCGRLGHISKTCKSERVCLTCGISYLSKEEDFKSCTAAKKCVNCGGNHISSDFSCPALVKRRLINRIMAEENIPFLEARRKSERVNHSCNSKNSYGSDFPRLSSPMSPRDSTFADARSIINEYLVYIIQRLTWDAVLNEWELLKENLGPLMETGERKDFLEFKKMESIARIDLRRIKRDKFKQFCESLRKDSNPSYIWNKIKRFKYRFNYTETRNKYDPDKIDTILSQIEEITPPWVPTNKPNFIHANQQESFLDLPFEDSEFDFAMKRLRGRSCIDNLSIIHSDITLCHDKGGLSVAVFLDIQAAYDNVLNDILINKLSSAEVSSKMLAYIHNLVSFRRVHFKFGSIDEIRSVFRGLPQGSVLSLLCDNRIPYILQSLEKALNSVCNFLKNIGLELSTNKTKFVVFEPGLRAKRPGLHSLQIGKDVIDNSSHARFLGLVFQANLGWDAQIKKIKESCQTPLKIINCIRHVWWGSNIERFAYPWAPTNILLAEAREPSLMQRWAYLSSNFVSRIWTWSNHPLKEIMDNIIESRDTPTYVQRINESTLITSFRKLQDILRVLESSPKFLGYSKHWLSLFYVPNVVFDRGRQLCESSSVQQDFEKIFAYETICTKCIYTDGSKKPDSEFLWLFADEEIFQYRSVGFLSTFTIETLAILETVEYCLRSDSRNFSIFSDSKSVLSALISDFLPNKSSHLLAFIKDKLRNANNMNKEISLFWIPSHRGIPGNEKADAYAKNAMVSGRDSQIEIPILDFKNLNKDTMYNNLFTSCENEDIENHGFMALRLPGEKSSQSVGYVVVTLHLMLASSVSILWNPQTALFAGHQKTLTMFSGNHINIPKRLQ